MGMLQAVIEAQPKPVPGKPPQPRRRQRIEREIWSVWDTLKAEKAFTASQARKLPRVTPVHTISVRPSYSSILSRGPREGHVDRIEEGSGPNSAIYRISD